MPDVGIEGRLAGLEFRDTILVLRSGPSSGFVFLFRVPFTGTVAEEIVEHMCRYWREADLTELYFQDDWYCLDQP